MMSFVLVTAAKNEQEFIGKTIRSVIEQTVLPEKWVIVSDGSTDSTDAIVSSYSKDYPFIQLIRRKDEERRNFGSKVRAIYKGIEALKDVQYEFIGNLDADIVLAADYYESILQKFINNPGLGIAGGLTHDYYRGSFRKQRFSPESVAGTIQLFRRECYEQIGGYLPLEIGNEDGVAEVMARMHGWKVRSFSEYKVLHLRSTGTAGRNYCSIRLSEGKLEYLFGYHPLFHLARTVQRIFDKPFILGSILRTSSYIWCYFKRPDRPVPDDYIQFLRREEMEKLKNLFLFRTSV